MTKLIAIDDGHGVDTAGKRTPILPNGEVSEIGRNYMNENLFNREVVSFLDVELKRCGFNTLLVANGDADIPLETRTKIANDAKADLYVSVHANANNGQWGTWGGIETLVTTKRMNELGKTIHKYMLQGTTLRDRGVKDGSGLWVIRKTNMPAVLVECGFMDSIQDHVYLLTDAYRKECAIELAKGVCEYFGVSYVVEEVVSVEPQPVQFPTPVQPEPVKVPVKPVVLYTGFVNASALNVRTRPDLNSSISTVLAKNAIVNVYGELRDGWLKIDNGHVKGKYITKGATPVQSIPNPKPASPKKVIPQPTLKKGSKGEPVKQLQTLLNKAGFNCGKVDGDFGNGTDKALKAWQKSKKLVADGVYGKASYSVMLK
jgi:N-acetylmuramoyl-L-alanine amidase